MRKRHGPLAAAGASVVIACRDVGKGEVAATKIRLATGNDHVDVSALELGDLDNVRAFAERFLSHHTHLDLLVNNAGVMACPLTRTAAGWEMQMATNHIGHFLLTNLLMDALANTAPARIVNLSSVGHQMAGVDFDDPFFELREYDPWLAYGQSKTANILFSVGLEQRFGDRGVHAFAVHPAASVPNWGGISRRAISPSSWRGPASTIPRRSRRASRPYRRARRTSVWAATSPDLADRGGLYLEDCSVGAPAVEIGLSGGYAPWALDAEGAERLWGMSEEWVGQRFP